MLRVCDKNGNVYFMHTQHDVSPVPHSVEAATDYVLRRGLYSLHVSHRQVAGSLLPVWMVQLAYGMYKESGYIDNMSLTKVCALFHYDAYPLTFSSRMLS